MIHATGWAARLRRAALLALGATVVLGAAATGQNFGEVGEQAPAYEARRLNTDEVVSVADLEGTPVLLNKWATWCRPCVEEMPQLEDLYQSYKGQGFEVIGVSIDRGDEDAPTESIVKDRDVTYPIWRDGEDLFTPTFRSTGVPESILIDANGVVVHRWRGVVEDTPTTRSLIERAIASEGDYIETSEEASEEEGRGVGLALAVFAGFLSFLSPCVLPLVPGYVAFITGVSSEDAQASGKHLALLNGLLFVAGFSAVFIALGATASAVGDVLRDNGAWIMRIGGALMVVFGLSLLGVLKIPGMERDTRFLTGASRAKERLGSAGSFVVGAAFGAGWTPCIGPVLASILALAAASGSMASGIGLLTAYSLGLAIPFLLATLALDRFILTSKRFRAAMPWVNRISGALLIVLGVLLVLGAMTTLSQWFSQFLPAGIG